MNPLPCPCQSGQSHERCCAPLHQGRQVAADAEALMRSRYCAYVLQHIDYLVATTVPAQQALLDTAAMAAWSRSTQWQGLRIHRHQRVGKQHALVEFSADFRDAGGQMQTHHELSAFVCMDGRWYFIDPTVALPAAKQPCVCGSGRKFKHCCGRWLAA